MKIRPKMRQVIKLYIIRLNFDKDTIQEKHEIKNDKTCMALQVWLYIYTFTLKLINLITIWSKKYLFEVSKSLEFWVYKGLTSSSIILLSYKFDS